MAYLWIPDHDHPALGRHRVYQRAVYRARYQGLFALYQPVASRQILRHPAPVYHRAPGERPS
ncbi:MAG: hypothetical protein KAG70_07625, partial [Alcanivorax sp.]|nr:hypothetical protein [Alcanivorax sp.]